MTSFKYAIAAMAVCCTQAVMAGGINTNTNMSVAFGRNLSREGAISIDGVYFNPAGATFLEPGLHLAINWQLITQHRSSPRCRQLTTGTASRFRPTPAWAAAAASAPSTTGWAHSRR